MKFEMKSELLEYYEKEYTDWFVSHFGSNAEPIFIFEKIEVRDKNHAEVKLMIDDTTYLQLMCPLRENISYIVISAHHPWTNVLNKVLAKSVGRLTYANVLHLIHFCHLTEQPYSSEEEKQICQATYQFVGEDWSTVSQARLENLVRRSCFYPTPIMFKDPIKMLVRDIMEIKTHPEASSCIMAEPIQGNAYELCVKFFNFKTSSALQQDLLRLGKNAVELRLEFHREMYPFYPPSAQLEGSRLKGMEGCSLLQLGLVEPLRFQYWDPSRRLVHYLLDIFRFMEEHTRVDESPMTEEDVKLERGLLNLEKHSGVERTYHGFSNLIPVPRPINSYTDHSPFHELANSSKQSNHSEGTGGWAKGTGYGTNERAQSSPSFYGEAQKRLQKKLYHERNLLKKGDEDSPENKKARTSLFRHRQRAVNIKTMFSDLQKVSKFIHSTPKKTFNLGGASEPSTSTSSKTLAQTSSDYDFAKMKMSEVWINMDATDDGENEFDMALGEGVTDSSEDEGSMGTIQPLVMPPVGHPPMMAKAILQHHLAVEAASNIIDQPSASSHMAATASKDKSIEPPNPVPIHSTVVKLPQPFGDGMHHSFMQGISFEEDMSVNSLFYEEGILDQEYIPPFPNKDFRNKSFSTKEFMYHFSKIKKPKLPQRITWSKEAYLRSTAFQKDQALLALREVYFATRKDLPPRVDQLVMGSVLLPFFEEHMLNVGLLEAFSKSEIYLTCLNIITQICQNSSILNYLVEYKNGLFVKYLSQVGPEAESGLSMLESAASTNPTVSLFSISIPEQINRALVKLYKVFSEHQPQARHHNRCGEEEGPQAMEVAPQSPEEKYKQWLEPLLFDSCPLIFQDAGKTPLSGHQVLRISHELRTLSQGSLPCDIRSSIFVRSNETNLATLRALITGPEGTPYANGCYLFDFIYPESYPQLPPKVMFVNKASGKNKINPNLYNTGAICLSLLGTWHGNKGEKWSPSVSTTLQVLISIQSMILTSQPYFNEPGFERQLDTQQGNTLSQKYNQMVYMHTLDQAMLALLRRPPAHFEEVIRRHFYLKRDHILAQAQEWVKEVGTQKLGKVYEQLAEELGRLTPPENL